MAKTKAINIEDGQEISVVHKKELTVRQLFIYILRFLKFLVVLSLLADIAAFMLVLVGGILADQQPNMERAFTVLSSVGFTIICVMLIIAEFGPEWFISRMRPFHYWGIRGGCLAWQGVMTISSVQTLSAAVAAQIDPKQNDAMLLMGQICGWFLISIGLLYVLFSALCLRSVGELDRVEEPMGDNNKELLVTVSPRETEL